MYGLMMVGMTVVRRTDFDLENFKPTFETVIAP